MLLDSQNMFSDQQALVLNAGTNALSTNVIDMGAVGVNALGGSPVQDPGRGKPLRLVAQVTVAGAGASSTLKVQVLMADSADMLTNPVILEQTDDIPVATLVAGYQFRLGTIPPGVSKRYLSLKYLNTSASNLTACSVSAGIVETSWQYGNIG